MSGSKINVHGKLAGKPRRVYGTKEGIEPNTWIIYHATLLTSGDIKARKALLWLNRTDGHEQDFLKLFACKIQLPDFTKHIDGNIKFNDEAAIKVIANRFIQDFVGQLAERLAPSSENGLPTQDQLQPKFRVYVVRPFVPKNSDLFFDINGDKPKFGLFSGQHLRYDAPKPGTMVRDIIAMPNGVILIPDVALANLKNQAQLTALLAYAITSIRQKEAYRAWPIITSPRARRAIAFNSDPVFVRAFGEWQTQQVLRIGIRKMYLAGYDIREAPYAWAVAEGKPVNNPVINSKDPDKEIPWYAAYAFNYISQNYRDVDYSKLKRGEKEYQQFLQELRKADPQAFAPQKADSKLATKAR
jgi:hypothetical protein